MKKLKVPVESDGNPLIRENVCVILRKTGNLPGKGRFSPFLLADANAIIVLKRRFVRAH